MREAIELCNADLNKATFKNTMFFSYAEGGAMGEPGGIYFFVESGELYHLNYVFGDVDMRKVKEFFPVLAECKFGIFGIGSVVPMGWHYIDLGMGNHLIVHDKMFEAFCSYIGVDDEPPVIYQKWKDIADKLLRGL